MRSSAARRCTAGKIRSRQPARQRQNDFRFSDTASRHVFLKMSAKAENGKILPRQSRNISATAAGGVLTGEFRRKMAGVSVRCMMFNQYHRAFLCCQCKTPQCSQMFYICPLRTVFFADSLSQMPRVFILTLSTSSPEMRRMSISQAMLPRRALS